MAATPLTIRLPKPHAKQLDIKRSRAKRKVVCAGRRAGKTTLAAEMAVEKMLEAKRVLLSSTTQEQADAFWDKCKDWLDQPVQAGVILKNEQRRTLQLGKGRIRVKTGSDADVLRGDSADFLVLDECAMLDPDAWNLVGAPMLVDNDGDAMFISTPRRRNWFHDLFKRGDGSDPRWQSWHFTTYDNPHLSQEAVAELTRDMTEDAIRQEILAEFLDDGGQVFKGVLDCATGNTQESRPGIRYVVGFDVARHCDFSVLSVMHVPAKSVVAFDRFQRLDWPEQIERVSRMAKAYNGATVWYDGTHGSQGDVLGTYLKQAGIDCEPVQFTYQNKAALVNALQLAIEHQEIRYPNIPTLVNELLAYEYRNEASAHPSTSAPEGQHDDCVMSLALAWHGANRTGVAAPRRVRSRYADQL